MISIDDIRSCVLVAKLGSMRRAADHLSVAPSVISRQIARIERTYGCPLFERRPDGISVTEQGHVFLVTATDIIRSLSDFESELARRSRNRRGCVKIHTVEGVTRSFLAPLIAEQQRDYPESTVSLTVVGRQLVLSAVEAYEADIGIVYDHFSIPSVETVARWKQPLLGFVRSSHPLLDKRPAQRELPTWPCALPDQTFGIRRLVDRAFRARGYEPAAAVIANQLQSLLHAAIEADLVTYMPLQAARVEVERGLLVPISTGFPEFDYRFVSVVVHAARPRAPHVETFLSAIRDAIGPADAADQQLLAERL